MKNRFGIIAVVIFLISIFLEIFFLSEKRELRSFKQTILKKEKVALRELYKLKNNLSQPSYKFDFKKYKKFYKDGYTFIAYRNDSLIFWSDNHLNLDLKYDTRFDQKHFLKFNNGKYVIVKNQAEKLTLIALIQITAEYPFQNKFLKNSLHKSFSTVYEIGILLDKTASSEYDIYKSSGKHLFSAKIKKRIKEDTWQAILVSLLYLLAFLLICFAFFSYLKKENRPVNRRINIFLFGIGLFAIRYLMIRYKLPTLVYSLSLFNPIQYASSFYFSSLGDFMLNSLSFFLLSYAFLNYYSFSKYNKKRWFFIILFISILIFSFLIFYILDFLKLLILDSNFSLQIQSFGYLNQYSIWGILSILLFIFGIKLGINKFSKWGSQHLSPQKFIAISGLSIFLGWIVYYREFEGVTNALFLFFLFVLFGIYTYSNKKNLQFIITNVIHIITAVYLVHFIQIHSAVKEREHRKAIAFNLAAEYDPISISLLSKINEKLKNDDYLLKSLVDPDENEELIRNYIITEYFTNYWELFGVNVTICNENDKLKIVEENDEISCFSYFSEIIHTEKGNKIPNTDFYLLEKFDGRIAYLGVLNHNSIKYGDVNLYIDIYSLSPNEGIGYPDLLLDQKYILNRVPEEYSYAKYSQNNLLMSSGSYDYNWTIIPKSIDNSNYNENGYNHFLYTLDNNEKIIVSKPIESKLVYWINLLYVFIFLYIFWSIIRLIENYPWNRFIYSTFEARIQIAFIAMIILFFTITVILTLYSAYNNFKQKNIEELNEKLITFKNEIHQHITSIDIEKINLKNYFSEIFRDYSMLLKTDVNLYDEDGNLIATSRGEIFEKGLQGEMINPAILFQFKQRLKGQIILQENLGNLHFSSAYVNINDHNKQSLFYLNLPYFLHYEKLQLDLLSIILGVINIYLFLAMISIFISFLLAKNLTSSLKLIQDKFKMIRLKGENKHIIYTRKDEIKNLVNAYNNLVDELEESTQALVKSERESAWREMAQQVAHEIKNPLTPMRLSLQHLLKSYENKSSNIEAQIKKTTNLLFEQISQLSTIATEFSNFARLPQSNNTLRNLVDIVKPVIQLYKNSNLNISLETTHDYIPVLIDEQLFERVYQNLLKNAEYAISEKKNGKIQVWLGIKDNKAISYVKDNGIGIDAKHIPYIFSPSFTTKSSGMGLGLVIVKNIINDANGKITFESKVNKGTTFYIELPLHQS